MAIIPFAIASSLVFINLLIIFICIPNGVRVCERMHSIPCFLCVCSSNENQVWKFIPSNKIVQKHPKSLWMSSEHDLVAAVDLKLEKKDVIFSSSFGYNGIQMMQPIMVTDAPKSLNPNQTRSNGCEIKAINWSVHCALELWPIEKKSSLH